MLTKNLREQVLKLADKTSNLRAIAQFGLTALGPE
jgi:hypothetical protein